ncbi:endonuclease/exonuclease/phosphatase family protein [Actinomadura sp. WMMA1423]|uniref:endonuclease/exonuclease/phosphatase family protein n=1 Tax=Actinomadura sp. WMMA1423 TaxID=2591108 RepID=UPI0011472EB7|nr:endonuclease/exonuclease/phosphatase family protein [Actinomadura sp. WMMA1423]
MQARVLTFNALFKGEARARMGVLAEMIEKSDYDVVCLQEVVSWRVLRVLRRAAPSFPHVACVPVFPLVRGGLVTLSRHPVTRRHFQAYIPARPVRPEWLLGKGALFTRIRLPDGHLTVVNTHLSANLDMDWSPSNVYARIERAELRGLAAAVDRIPRTEPLVAMGDFNVPRDSSYFAEFVSHTGLRDAFGGGTEPTFRPEYAQIGAIDQLLVTPGLDAQTRLVFKEEVRLPGGRSTVLSDHYGIEAVLTSGNAGA